MRLIVGRIASGDMTPSEAARRLRDGADWIMDQSGNGPSSSQIREVFEYWQTATGRPGTILTTDRRKKIKARLRARPVEALKHVIQWATHDDFFSDHDTIETLFRSDGKLEDYLSKSGWLQRTAKPGHQQTTREATPTVTTDDRPTMSLEDYLARHPEKEQEATAIRSILRFGHGSVSGGKPVSVGEILADGAEVNEEEI